VKAKEGITKGMMGAVAAGLILAVSGPANMEGPAIVDAFQSRGRTPSMLHD
jgi:hypothetical protein